MKKAILCLVITICIVNLHAQDIYQDYRKSWLEKAELYKPQLSETIKKPLNIVELIEDENAFQGWKATVKAPIANLYQSSFKQQSGIVLDFGEHMTGYFKFDIKPIKHNPDAPLRFKFTFGEIPSEVATPFDPYNGTLSRAWLQDEIVTVMHAPATIEIPRRLSFRYVKIELLASSPYYDFSISDISFKAVTSATSTPAPLASETSEMIKEIDRIGLNTLKECMQTVYEDGPKRDQRLWLGDLYLEALANNYSYRQHDLTRRCLYILAALSAKDGRIIATVLEQPYLMAQEERFMLDYAFLFNVTVKDLLEATGDKATAEDLWPVVKKQLDVARKYCQDNGLIDSDKLRKEWSLFFDWKEGLHKEVALQGVTIFMLRQTYELATMLGKEKELEDIPALIKKMTKAAQKSYYNKQQGLYIGLKKDQISYASQVWMILAGVPSRAEARKALTSVRAAEGVYTHGTPYMYHYFVQAMIDCGLDKEAKEAVESYWGSMVSKGADTFWEYYDPTNEYSSPYKFYPINSYCHAWSCTPVYFIRKYPEIFQR